MMGISVSRRGAPISAWLGLLTKRTCHARIPPMTAGVEIVVNVGLYIVGSPIALNFHRRNSSTTADSPVNLQSDRSIFNINIPTSILQETWCQLSSNRYRSAGPILPIRRGHPPPHRHRTSIVETHNMKTLKPKNPLRSAATAPLPLCVSGNVP